MNVLRAATREAVAFLLLARHMPRDLSVDIPEATAAGDDVVVLVHGALATAGAFRPLRERLESLGGRTAAFTYPPHYGVSAIAARLAGLVRQLPEGVRIHLVGHSLGGLAVRWFVQEYPADDRIVQTISVAAPFWGARGARLMPGPAGRDMAAGSAVLEQLKRRAGACNVPHLAIIGTADTAVSPDTTFPVGERIAVPDAAHNTLLFDPDVAAHVISRIWNGHRVPRPEPAIRNTGRLP
jgi:pimeloyl-ACP methyl ester carboxylesterase